MSDARQNRWFFGVIGRFDGFEELAPHERRPTAPPMVGRRSRGAALTQCFAQTLEEPPPAAFTLVELVVVIFTLAVLAALALPLLASPSVQSQQIQCLNNVKQLQMAWTSYAGDNRGRIAQSVAENIGFGGFATSGTQANAQPGQPYASWVLGDASNPDPTLITHGLIYPYVGSLGAYKCPSDLKTNTAGAPALRTYSMNAWMDGAPTWPNNVTTPMVTFTNLAGIGSHMQPAGALVFVEESYASINDGYWIQNLDQPTMWIDDPANYHLNACSLTFADGHCQSRTWTDKNVLAGVWNNYIGFPCDPTSPDLAWVQARCTVLSPAP